MSEVDDIANFLNDRIGAGDVESVRLLIEHYEIDVNIMSSVSLIYHPQPWLNRQ